MYKDKIIDYELQIRVYSYKNRQQADQHKKQMLANHWKIRYEGEAMLSTSNSLTDYRDSDNWYYTIEYYNDSCSNTSAPNVAYETGLYWSSCYNDKECTIQKEENANSNTICNMNTVEDKEVLTTIRHIQDNQVFALYINDRLVYCDEEAPDLLQIWSYIYYNYTIHDLPAIQYTFHDAIDKIYDWKDYPEYYSDIDKSIQFQWSC